MLVPYKEIPFISDVIKCPEKITVANKMLDFEASKKMYTSY